MSQRGTTSPPAVQGRHRLRSSAPRSILASCEQAHPKSSPSSLVPILADSGNDQACTTQVSGKNHHTLCVELYLQKHRACCCPAGKVQIPEISFHLLLTNSVNLVICADCRWRKCMIWIFIIDLFSQLDLLRLCPRSGPTNAEQILSSISSRLLAAVER